MEYINCPLCGKDRNKFLFKAMDYRLETSGDIFIVVKCLCCGMVYVNPRPSDTELPLFYPKEYYNFFVCGDTLLSGSKKICDKKFKMIRKNTGRLLEVGCGTGIFSYYMKQKGWEVVAVDNSGIVADVFNIGILRGRFRDLSLKEDYYDVAVLWASLEHIVDPKYFLSRLNRVLAHGGQLLISVPNFNSISCRFMRFDDVPRHITMFTKSTITRMLEDAGFVVKRVYFNSDISEASSRGLLEVFIKILLGHDKDKIFANIYSRDVAAAAKNRSLLQKIRHVGIFWSFVKAVDIPVSYIVDRLSMLLGFYGIMIIDVEKNGPAV